MWQIKTCCHALLKELPSTPLLRAVVCFFPAEPANHMFFFLLPPQSVMEVIQCFTSNHGAVQTAKGKQVQNTLIMHIFQECLFPSGKMSQRVWVPSAPQNSSRLPLSGSWSRVLGHGYLEWSGMSRLNQSLTAESTRITSASPNSTHTLVTAKPEASKINLDEDETITVKVLEKHA